MDDGELAWAEGGVAKVLGEGFFEGFLECGIDCRGFFMLDSCWLLLLNLLLLCWWFHVLIGWISTFLVGVRRSVRVRIRVRTARITSIWIDEFIRIGPTSHGEF